MFALEEYVGTGRTALPALLYRQSDACRDGLERFDPVHEP